MGLRGIKSISFRTQNQILSKVAKYGLYCLVKISFKPRDPSIAGLLMLFWPKKVNAKNLLLRLDYDENQIRCNIMKFVYRCDEFSICMWFINVWNINSQKSVKKTKIVYIFININILNIN